MKHRNNRNDNTCPNTAPTAPTHVLPYGRSYFVVDTLYIGPQEFPYRDSFSLSMSGVLYSRLSLFSDNLRNFVIKFIRDMESTSILDPNILNEQFNEIVGLINETKKKVYRIANTVMIELYWRIGERLAYRVAESNWGDGVIRQLADYIAANTEDHKGYSDKNLWRMKQFYDTYREADEKLSALLRQINWTNNLTIMSRSISPTLVAEYQLNLPPKMPIAVHLYFFIAIFNISYGRSYFVVVEQDPPQKFPYREAFSLSTTGII